MKKHSFILRVLIVICFTTSVVNLCEAKDLKLQQNADRLLIETVINAKKQLELGNFQKTREIISTLEKSLESSPSGKSINYDNKNVLAIQIEYFRLKIDTEYAVASYQKALELMIQTINICKKYENNNLDICFSTYVHFGNLLIDGSMGTLEVSLLLNDVLPQLYFNNETDKFDNSQTRVNERGKYFQKYQYQAYLIYAKYLRIHKRENALSTDFNINKVYKPLSDQLEDALYRNLPQNKFDYKSLFDSLLEAIRSEYQTVNQSPRTSDNIEKFFQLLFNLPEKLDNRDYSIAHDQALVDTYILRGDILAGRLDIYGANEAYQKAKNILIKDLPEDYIIEKYISKLGYKKVSLLYSIENKLANMKYHIDNDIELKKNSPNHDDNPMQRYYDAL